MFSSWNFPSSPLPSHNCYQFGVVQNNIDRVKIFLIAKNLSETQLLMRLRGGANGVWWRRIRALLQEDHFWHPRLGLPCLLYVLIVPCATSFLVLWLLFYCPVFLLDCRHCEDKSLVILFSASFPKTNLGTE